MPSSPRRRWSDLSGAAVGVWGVGVEGRATIDKLEDLGIVPAAVVDDAAAAPEVLATDAGGLDALLGCEVVVKSPGISRYADRARTLEGAGVELVGGLGLWLETVGTDRVIGVTGTKGKSTTVSVAGHLAQGLGVRCSTGGNLGTVPWSRGAPVDVDLWVIEVSSYQATDLWSSPGVVGVTSLHPDHLDWHGSVDAYVRDKLGLCGRPGARITVANGEDAWLRQHAELLRPGPRWITGDAGDTTWTPRLGLRGPHNVRNAVIAAACLEEMGIEGADDPSLLADAATGYEQLPHRLQTVRILGGVEYVDDSLSTNVLPTIAAAEVFEDRPLALLLGGMDRHIDYAPLARFLALRSAPTLALTLPQNGDRIHREMEATGVPAVACTDIPLAVHEAASWAPPGAVVLLSPAAASYGRYRNYAERSQAFAAAVDAIAAAGT